MVTYSNSRLASFEQCPYQYKLKYIDKVKVDIPTTIEAFMGDLVHQTLEKLYQEKLNGVLLSMDEVVSFYLQKWLELYTPDILVAKKDQGLTAENYKLTGLKFITDFYNRKKPFDGNEILGLETKHKLRLADGNFWYVMIDKLERDEFGNYYVCDYKTNARMKSREETDSDRQLAMYAAWVKEAYPDAKNILLKWEMLAFNTEVTSARTPQEIEALKKRVVDIIAVIEKTVDFPQKPSALCNYCVFKDICPSKNPSVENPIPSSLPQKKLFV